MFLGLKLLLSTRKNAVKFVVAKKKDVFAVIFQTLPLLYVCEQMCGTKPRKNLVIVVSLLVSLVIKDQVSLLLSLGISATPLNNETSEADKRKVR